MKAISPQLFVSAILADYAGSERAMQSRLHLMPVAPHFHTITTPMNSIPTPRVRQFSVTVLLLFLGIASGLAQVTTNTWTNTAGGSFSVSNNWSNSVVPVSGNTVIALRSGLTYTNDLSNLLLNGGGTRTVIRGTNITLRGNAITLTNGAGINLGQTSFIESDLAISNYVYLDAGFEAATGGATNTVSGVVSGNASITSRGGVGPGGEPRVLVLNNNNNSFAGGLIIGTPNHKVQATSIGNVGQNSALGSNGAVILTGFINPGTYTLEFVGSSSASSSDRGVQVGWNATNTSGQSGALINNNTNAAHTLTFTRSNFNNLVSSINTNVALVLGGSNTGLNTIAGIIRDNNANAGSIGLTKTNAGTWVLGGSNSYRGATTVAQGRLIINGNQSAATGAVTVAAGATLGGSGTIGGATTINGIHSPGTSPGIQTFTNGLTYNTNASVVWELIANGVGTRGVDYDGVNVTGGTLNFAGPTTLNLTFNLTNSSAVDWSNAFWAGNYTNTSGWLVYNAASAISGFDNLALSASTNWIDSLGQSLTSVRANASFSVYHDTSNNDIYLNYAVPEPSTYALLVLAAAGLAAHVVRRRAGRTGR